MRNKIIETWNIKGKKRRVFVARNEKGQMISWRKVAKSGLKKTDAQEIFKKNKSFFREKQVQKLTNFKEVTILKKSNLFQRDKKIITPKPTGKIIQYVVQGYYGNKKIVARSQALGEKFAKNSTMAKNEAWNNFLKLLSQSVSGGYDEDEGLKNIDKVTNIKEGWVVYR